MLLHQWQCADSTGGTNCGQSAGYQRLALTKWLKQGSQKKEWEQQRQSEMCFWESASTHPALFFTVPQIQWLRHLLGTLKHGCSYIWCLVLQNCENHELSLWPIRKLDWRREEEWLGVEETYEPWHLYSTHKSVGGNDTGKVIQQWVLYRTIWLMLCIVGDEMISP